MKVIDFIKRIKELGYTKDTDIDFDLYDKDDNFCFSLDDSFDIDGENRKYGHDYISIKFRFPPSYLPPEYMKKQMHKAMEEL